ncbi:type VII secretion protein EccE [Spirilliplanes yamanashiensis]|uniref:Type VII secretion protein EccE n=1 Tax=Spirilliplanes yamanashiensis TaxID=42233 RepID=A0A8J3Y8V0_9ACTN|nr:type VII secretion protein EccE [Spirilliplanes yamanashiensis]MDP9815395.1 type VII secretion protein EccE [Spirilliplanes yamanashiensis]GIJ03650.1 hypothetical protein Sya03_30020 [Spirilliplanes yamanashiensis]
MTAGVAATSRVERGRAQQKRRAPTTLHRGRLLGAGAGQLVATQVAVVLVLAGLVAGTAQTAAAAVLAALLLAGAWARFKGRWAYEWAGTLLQFAGRRHGTADGDLLALVAPGTVVSTVELAGESTAVLADGYGVTAVLEIGDPNALLADDAVTLPSPESLLPPGKDGPPVSAQLLLTAVPAPALRAGAALPANSYRQLTDGRLLSHTRTLLALRVLRTEGWSEEDLHRVLGGLIRKVPRRLPGVPVRPLGEAAAVQAVHELAHHRPDQPGQESWAGLSFGGLEQATYTVGRLARLRPEAAQRLVGRVLALPATATTVAITAGPRTAGGTAAEVTVRLAAPDERALAAASGALRQVLAAEHVPARRLDGAHLSGLAATLPLGGGTRRRPPEMPAGEVPATGVLAGIEPATGAGGLMIGSNRHGEPVVARLFRPEQTRAVLVGGVRLAQLVALRAMALGARVVVQTARPQAWEPFGRGVATPGETLHVVPPGRALEMPPGSQLHPLLVIVDVGPVGADTRPGHGWQATLVVRDEFLPVDVDVASRADLLILQPLRPDEAGLAAASLGLGDAAQWLTRIRADMVGVVVRRAVRWVALSTTPIEQQQIGPIMRG